MEEADWPISGPAHGCLELVAKGNPIVVGDGAIATSRSIRIGFQDAGVSAIQYLAAQNKGNVSCLAGHWLYGLVSFVGIEWCRILKEVLHIYLEANPLHGTDINGITHPGWLSNKNPKYASKIC